MLMQAKKHDLVLIHGWGMPGKIFTPVLPKLEKYFVCKVLELPGDNETTKLEGVDAYANYILAQVSRPAIFLGWSLGGILALKSASLVPTLVHKLILVNSTPKFVNSINWTHGVDARYLDSFYSDMKKNYQKTIKTFLTLQTMYSQKQRTLIREISGFLNGKVDLYSLKVQLDILKHSDMRSELKNIDIPNLWLAGRKDTLCPQNASVEAAQMSTGSEYYSFENSGHLPFWTETDKFVEIISSWA